MTEKKQWVINGWIKQDVLFYVEAESAEEAEEKVMDGEWNEYEPSAMSDWETNGEPAVVVE